MVVDTVATPVPAGALRPMFRYRHRQLAADLAAHARAREACPQPLTVALTGASGLVGSSLAALLTTGGHRVIRLVRRAARDDGEREWRPDDPDPALLDGVDAVIHLAGAPIGGRFSPERKREIMSSRVGPTRALATLAARNPGRLRVFVTASAVGFYGADRGDQVLTESSGQGDGFLADVTAAWEDAASPALAAGIRTVQVRTGIVQTPRGGMLRMLYPLFEAGRVARSATAPDGSPGSRSTTCWTSTCARSPIPRSPGRLTRSRRDRRETPTTRGPSAGCSACQRSSRFPRPARRLLLGAEGATELAAASQRACPAALATAGHPFRYPGLEGALRHVLGREQAGVSAAR